MTIKIKSKNQSIYRLAYPLNVTRIVPIEVPDVIRSDFQEASSVSSISAKASAALSRRCLQNMLNEQGYTGNNLCDQISNVLKDLPTWLVDNVDSIRKIGNFAAHLAKSKSTGEIVDVEQGEAEWNLDVLEQLFDFFYVQPKIAKMNRDKLNAKLGDIDKTQLKK